MTNFVVLQRYLAEIVILSNRDIDLCMESIKIRFPNLKTEDLVIIRRALSQNFLPRFLQRWTSASRNKNYFYKKFENWLEEKFVLELDSPKPSGARGPGRPEKGFLECCDRTKRYKIKNMCDNFSPDLIHEAANKVKGKLCTIMITQMLAKMVYFKKTVIVSAIDNLCTLAVSMVTT